MWLPPNYIQDSTNDWPGTWTVTHLIRTKGTFRASRALADESSKVARLAYLQLYGLLDPGERLLPPGARLLFVDERLVARVASHWPQLRNVVREALWEAAAFGRLLVLPRLPCDAPWSKGLHRRDDERLLWDRRPGAGGGAGDAAFRCYAGVHIHTSCWPGERVAMAFDPEVVARRPGARRGGDLAQPGDVVVSHFSKAHELRPGGTADQTAVVPPGDGRAGLLQARGRGGARPPPRDRRRPGRTRVLPPSAGMRHVLRG